MKGVDLRKFGLNRQIQIITDEHIYAIGVTKSFETVDRDGSKTLFEAIRNHGVEKWESKQFFVDKSGFIFLPIVK
jgi:hypothetical protein